MSMDEHWPPQTVMLGVVNSLFIERTIFAEI